MQPEKMGQIIRTLRKEKGLTQRQLADKLGISDKTISKWERGMGCPDVAWLPQLSELLEVSLPQMLQGDLSPNEKVGGNMKKLSYFICPTCGSLSFCTGASQVSCCGRNLSAKTPQKAPPEAQLSVEHIEDEWYITSSHPMKKEDYISFVAFVTGERLEVIKQYPEWNLQLRIPKRGHGKLVWYSHKLGLQYQLL